MTPTDSTAATTKGPRGRRAGCLILLVVLGVVVAAGLLLAGVAHLQIQDQEPEIQTVLPQMPEPTEPSPAPPAAVQRGRLDLELSVAQLIVVPAREGEPMRLDAEYDPRFYKLEQSRGEGDPWTYRVRFAPAGSSAMALLRVKLGSEPPTLRLTLPRDVSLDIVGQIDGSYAALELGGLRLGTVDLEVSGGAAAVSFLEPLQEPMEDVTMVGDKGSVKVVGLGNASPRSAFFQQHLGELDLDLRGAWVRDAEIDTRAHLAGGTVWLPRNARIEGLDGRRSGLVEMSSEEIPRPRLRITTTETGGRLVFVE